MQGGVKRAWYTFLRKNYVPTYINVQGQISMCREEITVFQIESFHATLSLHKTHTCLKNSTYVYIQHHFLLSSPYARFQKQKIKNVHDAKNLKKKLNRAGEIIVTPVIFQNFGIMHIFGFNLVCQSFLLLWPYARFRNMQKGGIFPQDLT